MQNKHGRGVADFADKILVAKTSALLNKIYSSQYGERLRLLSTQMRERCNGTVPRHKQRLVANRSQFCINPCKDWCGKGVALNRDRRHDACPENSKDFPQSYVRCALVLVRKRNCAVARICTSIRMKLSDQVTSQTLICPVRLVWCSVPQPRNPARVGYEISPLS
jgi:hypothetical protein